MTNDYANPKFTQLKKTMKNKQAIDELLDFAEKFEIYFLSFSGVGLTIFKEMFQKRIFILLFSIKRTKF
jgi:hypothetical protein